LSSDLLDSLVTELGKILDPLRDAVVDPGTLASLLAEIGANPESAGGDGLATALSAVVTLADQIEQLIQQPSPSFAGIAAILESSRKAFAALRSLSASGGPAAAFASFGTDLADFLIIFYLWNWHPLLHEVAILASLIKPAEEADPHPPVVQGGAILRMPFQLEQFRFGQVGALVKDPLAALWAEYGNPLATVADANAMAAKLFPRVLSVLRLLGVTCRYGFDPQDAPLLADSAPFVDHALIVYTADLLMDAATEAGIIVTISSADRGDLGFVFTPFGSLTETWQVNGWNIEIDLTADVQGFAIGRHGFTLLADLNTAEIDGKLTATLAAPTGGPAYLIGSSSGSRVEVGGVDFGIQTSLSETKQSLAITADVLKSTLVIASGDGDGFLQSVLPAGGLKADFDFGMAGSNTGGLSFHGAAGLDATLPVGISIGGVITVPTIHLALQAAGTGVTIEVSAGVGLLIGPVKALVDRVGLNANITFPDSGGNLGIANLDFAFKPPSGVGLAIDSAGVTGGGFLAFDTTAHLYSGVLQLTFNDLSLQAFGLITTQVAGGDGYSLLALIDANFPPVQLGWGFTLDGVGGLLAVHRSASTDALRTAMKGGKLSSVLFPKSAIANASLVLGQLNTLFPTAPGRFLFGPMAQIGWGTPTLLTASIAVILELPEPIEIILLATLEAKLPSPSAPLVHLHMDALGVLDLTQGELSLDATLYDSKLITFTLTGDMALRANWATQREFLLAIGGFHPQFTPPSDFPALKRITIDMPSGAVAKLRLAAYLAITSNSLQFGAQLDVFIGVSGFGLAGHLAFDALLQLDPFHFDADISGSVALMAGGDDLTSISLDATLSGPAPWNIAGKFKIHVVFFDVHISFSHSWGQDAPTPQTAAIDVGQLLNAALADPRSWDAQLPNNFPALVATNQVTDPSIVFAHPMAQLQVHETIVPLGLAITHFGGAVASGATEFSITELQVGSVTVATQPVQEDFAPSQFFDLSDTDKLAGPSFERHDAGVIMSGDLFSSGPSLIKTISYETWFIDTAGGTPRTDQGVPVQSGSFTVQTVLASGAVAKKAIDRAGNNRYLKPANPLRSPIRVAEPSFVLASTGVVTTKAPLVTTTVAASTEGTTYSDMRAALKQQLAKTPGLQGAIQIVAAHETAVAR
jgi:hypothetical protein